MLIIMRRKDESVIVGNKCVKVLEIARAWAHLQVCDIGGRGKSKEFMLRLEQRIGLGDKVEMALTRTSATQAFLMFKAPRDVFILRSELMDAEEGVRLSHGNVIVWKREQDRV